jgi:hypothetical protein
MQKTKEQIMTRKPTDLDIDSEFGIDLDDQLLSLDDAEPTLPDESATQKLEPWAFEVSLLATTYHGQPCAEIYAHGKSDFLRDGQDGDREELLARVSDSEIATFPLVSSSYRNDFMEPKYGVLKSIRISFSTLGISPRIPEKVEDFDSLLARLPIGFSGYARFGLGFKHAYRLIPEALQRNEKLTEILITDGDDAEIHKACFHLGIDRFDSIRRSIDRITDRANIYSLRDRRLLAYNELLHKADPTHFERAIPKARPGEIFELIQLRSRAQNLSEADREAAALVVETDAEKMAKSAPKKLLGLKAVIELVTLKELIAKMTEMLDKNLTESKWQAFFKENTFILSLAFPHPVILVQDQASVGGTLLNGKGESIADFLLRQKFTGSLALIEIKRPSSRVLEQKPFRGDLFAPHKDLTSAIAQVLDQRTQLQMNFTVKAQDPKLKDSHISSVSCIVIIGTTPGGVEENKSFDLYRNSTRDVAVVTFDELLSKLKEILRLLTPNTPEAGAAPEECDVPF